MKAKVISFPSTLPPKKPKTKLRDNNFDVRREYTKFLTRPNGKHLSAIQTLLLDTLKNWAKKGESFTTYKYLMKSKFFHATTKQTVTRNLKDLENYINWQWKKSIIINGRRRFNVIIFSIKDTFENDEKKAQEKLKTEAQEYKATHQKCRVKLIKNDEVYIKQTNTNSNNIFPQGEEILLPKERSKINKKKKEMKNDEVCVEKNISLKNKKNPDLIETTKSNEGIPVTLGACCPTSPITNKERDQMNDSNSCKTDSKVEIDSKKENNKESLMKGKTEPKNNPQELANEKHKALWLRQKLDIAIHSKLPPKIYFQLQKNLVVKNYTSTKVTLQFKQKLNLSIEEKNQLRSCVKEVYGKEIDITVTSDTIPVTTNSKPIETKKSSEMFFREKKDKVWQQIKTDIAEKLGIYKDRALAWMNHERLTVDSFEDDKLVIKTTPVCADYINDICQSKLTDSAKTMNISIEIIFGSNKYDHYVYS